MYWSRTGSPIEMLLFLVQCLAWTVGGWLWVTHAFRLRSDGAPARPGWPPAC